MGTMKIYPGMRKAVAPRSWTGSEAF